MTTHSQVRRAQNERGSALIIALLATMLLTALGLTLVMMSNTETAISANYRNSQETLYAADAAVERVVQDLLLIPRWNDVLAGDASVSPSCTGVTSFLPKSSTPSAFVDGSTTVSLPNSSQQINLLSATCNMLPPTTAGGTGTFKLYGLKDNDPASGATTKFSINLATVSTSSGLVSGERASASPTVAGDIVFYTTTTETASTPCAEYSSSLRALTYTGTAAYDANGNGKLDTNESTVVKTMTGRATAPFIVDQHLYVGTVDSTGTNVQAFGDAQDFNNGVGQVGVRILSWREIR